MYYFNIGQNKMIAKNSLIGIFDMDTATVQNESKKFLRNSERRGKIEYVGSDIPRAFILTDEKIYITTLSPKAAERRLNIQSIK